MLVRNAARQWEGVNALLYSEPAEIDPLSEPATTRSVLAAIDAHVGRARAQLGSLLVVPPGGNEVDAYIDVVVGGTLALEDLDAVERRTLAELERPEAAETVAWTDRRLLVRAYVRPDKAPADVLSHLIQACRTVVRNPQRTQAPITIQRVREAAGVVFELNAASAERLRALHGEGWTAPRIGISDDVREAFEATHGDIHSFLVGVMTGGIDAPYLARLGGVEIVDERGEVIWPARAAL